jgi:transposase-like protein
LAKSRHRAPPSTKRRTRWTPERARQVLAELEGSELPVAAFATQCGLHPQRLYRWRRRMATKARAITQAPAFAEVTVRRHDREHGVREGFEIELGRGRIVRVGPSFDAEALRRLLRVLEEDGPC